MAAPRKVRILMLCGYTQNATIFRGRLGALRKSLPDTVEMHFVDPPHIVDMPTTSAADLDSSATASSSAPQDVPRSWWTFKDSPTPSDPNAKTYPGLSESLVFLRQVLDAAPEPYDGVWGFSQGAAMAGILVSVLEKPEICEAFRGYEGGNVKWCVVSAGFKGVDPEVKGYFAATTPLKTPSLHVLGRGDTIVGEDRSLPFVDIFEKARVEWHDGGHHTPSKASWRKFFKQFIEANGDWEAIQNLESPGGPAIAAAL